MKPLHVGILVVVAAVGGGLFTKWQTSRNVAPIAMAKPAAPAAPIEKPAAMEPVAATQLVAHQAETAVPAQVPQPERRPALNEIPRKHGKTRPIQPRMVARGVTPHREPEVNAVPGPAVQAEPPTQAEPSQAAPPQPEQAPAEQVPVVNVPPDPPAPVQVTLRSGTLLSARTVEGLSSERNQVGDTFTATLEQPLSVEGWVIAERGAHLEGKFVQSQRAGRVKGL